MKDDGLDDWRHMSKQIPRDPRCTPALAQWQLDEWRKRLREKGFTDEQIDAAANEPSPYPERLR